MSLKLVSVNIEGQKHLKLVREFLDKEQADVACMMEVFEDTLPQLVGDYPYVEFAPSLILDQDEVIKKGNRIWGEVIMSRYPLINVRRKYCGEWSAKHLPKCPGENHVPTLILAEINMGEQIWRVGTIHFTWTPQASVTEKQRTHMQQLLGWLEGVELVLCGDFNIPRGNEVYQLFSRRLRDNIPSSISTTLDPILHYANKAEQGKLKLVVDYVWSTPEYLVKNVRVISGVSDHCALVCEMFKMIS